MRSFGWYSESVGSISFQYENCNAYGPCINAKFYELVDTPMSEDEYIGDLTRMAGIE